MYLWTAERIEKDPFIVYKGKVKPAKIRIFTQIMKNFLTVRGAA